MFDFVEQKKQKVSEIKSGLDEAEALVIYSKRPWSNFILTAFWKLFGNGNANLKWMDLL